MTRIGLYTDALSYGGSELFLKLVMETIDRSAHDVVLFHREGYDTAHLCDTGVFSAVVLDKDVADYPLFPASSPSVGASQADPPEALVAPAVESWLRSISGRGWKFLSPRWLKLLVGEYRAARRAAKLIAAARLDVMICFEASPSPDLMPLAARMAQVESIITTFAVLPYSPGAPRYFPGRLLAAFAMRASDHVFFNSRSNMESWLSYTLKRPVSADVISYGISLCDLSSPPPGLAALREEFGLHSGHFVIGLTARLHPMKGHRHLIDALALLVPEHPEIRLLLVGEGVERERIEQQVSDLDLQNHVIFAGHRDDASQIAWLFDLGTLPSVEFETFGIVNLEAMVCAKPVVASRFGGIPEVVVDGETGILCPPGDVDALADAIRRIVENGELARRLGLNGRRRVEEAFGIEQMNARVRALFAMS